MNIKEIIQKLRTTMDDARGQESHFESWLTQNEGICDAIDALKELDSRGDVNKEAIAHYEAALKEVFPSGATGDVFYHWNEARKILSNEALERMAENARELGLDYEPAAPVQEPVVHQDWCASLTQLLLSMPPQKAPCNCQSPKREWVGLTDEEIDKTHETQVWDARRSYARAIEAKLREKNT